ncbi:MAG: hypothetical protein WCO35_01875 [Candidatus Nomurabacteria bacterium]
MDNKIIDLSGMSEEEKISFFKQQYVDLLFKRSQGLTSIEKEEDQELDKLTEEFSNEFVKGSDEYKSLLLKKNSLTEKQFHNDYIDLIKVYIDKYEIWKS